MKMKHLYEYLINNKQNLGANKKMHVAIESFSKIKDSFTVFVEAQDALTLIEDSHYSSTFKKGLIDNVKQQMTISKYIGLDVRVNDEIVNITHTYVYRNNIDLTKGHTGWYRNAFYTQVSNWKELTKKIIQINNKEE